MANSRQNIRKLVKDGFVIRKPQKVSILRDFILQLVPILLFCPAAWLPGF